MKTTKPKLNIKLLRKVQKHILEEPKRLNMGAWSEPSLEAPCGTVACIAGWALILTGEKQGNVDYGCDKKAAKRLGISHAPGISAQDWKLFYVPGWPNHFSNRYEKATTSITRAKVTAQRIDYFIQHRK